MKEVVIAITAASYSGNKGAAAMLQSSIRQLYEKYGTRLKINLMSVYPEEDKEQIPWDFIRIGVTKRHLFKEWERAAQEIVTPNCREKCSGCGAAVYGGGVCFENQN